MIYGLGPRARRVYESLRHSIDSGEFAPGAKLPSHTELSGQFGVAPMTARLVLARLEEDGFVTRQQGRGTFVRARSTPTVLIVEDDIDMRMLITIFVKRAGYNPVTAASADEALSVMEGEPGIALVFSDIRMPHKKDGIGFIRTVRRRWPAIPLAAITGYPEDLTDLLGTPECPVLILSKPVAARQFQEALALVFGSRSPASTIGLTHPGRADG